MLLDDRLSALDTHLRESWEKLLIANIANYRGVTLSIAHNLEEADGICQNLLGAAQKQVSPYWGRWP